MNTYISILRGINIGGHKKIKMDALRQMYTNLGYTEVQSYIQSGNVTFNSSETNILDIEKIISEKILQTFGFEVTVLIITADEFRNAIKTNPFQKDTLKDPAFMHLTFLSCIPENNLQDSISPADYLPDEFRIIGRTIYIYCPNGYGNTKITNNFFENKLKLTATTRNLKTCTELLSMAEKTSL